MALNGDFGEEAGDTRALDPRERKVLFKMDASLLYLFISNLNFPDLCLQK